MKTVVARILRRTKGSVSNTCTYICNYRDNYYGDQICLPCAEKH